MKNIWRKVRIEDTVKYFFEGTDEQEYIELRADITKAEANRLLGNSPTKERDIIGALSFYEYAFTQLVVTWTYRDEENSPIAPTLEAYRALPAETGREIDGFLQERLNKILGVEAEASEGKSDESPEKEHLETEIA